MKYHAPKRIISFLCLVFCTALTQTAFAQTTNEEGATIVFDKLTVEFSGDNLVVDFEIDPESWEQVRQFDPQLGVYLPDEPTTVNPDFVLHERFPLEQRGQHQIALTEDLVYITEVALSLYDEEDRLRAIETPDAIATNLRLVISPEIISFEAIERPTPQPRSTPHVDRTPFRAEARDQPRPRTRTRCTTHYCPGYGDIVNPDLLPPVERARPDRFDRPDRPSRFDGAIDARQRRQESYRQKSEGPSTHDRRTEQLERRIESRQDRGQQQSD